MTAIIILLSVLMGFFLWVRFSLGKAPKTYTIEEGDHYSNHRTIRWVTGKRLDFKFTLHRDCLYQAFEGGDRLDINKLYGVRIGILGKNSARLGWNCIDGQLYLYPYIHLDGKNLGALEPAPLCKIDHSVEYRGTIHISDESFAFVVEGPNFIRTYVSPKGKSSWFKFLSYPHFGGNRVAPHNMNIEIQNI